MLQILLTILFSSFKFAATFPLVVLQFKFSFAETILWTNVGGIAGIYFFAFLSEKILAWWNRTFGIRKHKGGKEEEKKKKIFTKKNRRIVRVRQKYGLPGIAFFTPLLLSIPVGTFLVVRYYNNSKIKFYYLIASNLIWSLIYTLFYMFWNGIIFKNT